MLRGKGAIKREFCRRVKFTAGKLERRAIRLPAFLAQPVRAAQEKQGHGIARVPVLKKEQPFHICFKQCRNTSGGQTFVRKIRSQLTLALLFANDNYSDIGILRLQSDSTKNSGAYSAPLFSS